MSDFAARGKWKNRLVIGDATRDTARPRDRGLTDGVTWGPPGAIKLNVTLIEGTSMSNHRTTRPIEQLEPRTMLSTTLNSRGVLYVLGTSQNDALSVYLAGNDTTKIEVRDRGVISQFQRSAVTQVIFQGSAATTRS